MIDEPGPLSGRELEVVRRLVTGASNQQIARALVISPNTVKVHLRNIFEKLGVQSRTEASTEAIRRGLVDVGVSINQPLAGVEATPAVVPDAHLILPVALWQRVYMMAAAALVLAAALVPGWVQSRAPAPQLTPFSDSGRRQEAPLPRPQVSRWLARAPLPEPRSRLALAAVGGKLYAIGGETATGITDQVTVYDPTSNGWLPAARKPTAAANIAAAVVGDLVYLPGGTVPSTPERRAQQPSPLRSPVGPQPFTSIVPSPSSSSPVRPSAEAAAVSSVLEVYDPRTDLWTKRAPLPVPLAGYGLAVFDGRIYLFGGWDGKRYRPETYIYDPGKDHWSASTPMPAGVAFVGAAVLENMIYVVGGYDGGRELDTVRVYNPSAESVPGGPWTLRGSLAQGRAGLGLIALGSRLYAIGGGWQGDLAFNEQFDRTTGAWSRIESPLLGQWRTLGVAAEGSKLHAVGGWSEGFVASNEEYHAIFRILLPVNSLSR